MSDITTKAFEQYTVARDALIQTLNDGDSAIAREYYRSKARPLDEAKIERIRGVAQQIDAYRRKGDSPDADTLARWSQALWKIDR